MQNNFTHFLVTRYNVPWTNGKKPSEQWLKERNKLFFKFCYSSVLSQINNNFKWIIYIDINSPMWFLDGMSKIESDKILFMKVATFEEMKNRIKSDVIELSTTPFVITSRLDNDDVISPYYIDLIQKNLKLNHNTFINFKDGACYSESNRAFSVYEYFNSPFLTLIENRNKEVNTILDYDHTFVKNAVQIDGNNWLQIIHSDNLSNQLRGKVIYKKEIVNNLNWIDFSIFKYSFIKTLNNSNKKTHTGF